MGMEWRLQRSQWGPGFRNRESRSIPAKSVGYCFGYLPSHLYVKYPADVISVKLMSHQTQGRKKNSWLMGQFIKYGKNATNMLAWWQKRRPAHASIALDRKKNVQLDITYWERIFKGVCQLWVHHHVKTDVKSQISHPLD